MVKATTSSYIKAFTFVFVSCCLFLSNKGIGQCDHGGSSQISGTPVERLVNREGWVVPGLKGSRPLGNRIPDTQSMPGVTIYELKPGAYSPIKLTHYETTTDSKTLIAEPSPYFQIIRALERYEVNGHVFAYIAQTDTVAGCALDKTKIKPGKKHGSGPICGGVQLCGPTFLEYYDNDGDGKFETFEVTLGIGIDLRVPDWAKKLSIARK